MLMAFSHPFFRHLHAVRWLTPICSQSFRKQMTGHSGFALFRFMRLASLRAAAEHHSVFAPDHRDSPHIPLSPNSCLTPQTPCTPQHKQSTLGPLPVRVHRTFALLLPYR